MYHAGEVTSRSIAPLHQYLVTEQTSDQKADEPTRCLFTDIKRNAGYAKLSTQPTPQAEIIDESFINYKQFVSLINAEVMSKPQNKTVSCVLLVRLLACVLPSVTYTGYRCRRRSVWPLLSVRAQTSLL